MEYVHVLTPSYKHCNVVTNMYMMSKPVKQDLNKITCKSVYTLHVYTWFNVNT